MNTQWRKIAGDFRERRLQIFLIALILVLGIGGVVAALNAATAAAHWSLAPSDALAAAEPAVA